MTPLKTGKKPAQPDSRNLLLRGLLAPTLPLVPTSLGHELGLAFGMLGNDRYGDCVWAGAAHERMVICAEAGTPVHFTEADALDDYAAVTGFSPLNPFSDQGTDLNVAASYRRKTGIRDWKNQRWKDDAYAFLNVGDVNQLAAAVWLFNTVGLGVMLPPSAQNQFRSGLPWTVVPGEQGADGHYVSVVGRNSRGNFLVVTWGALHAVTPPWIEAYMDEGIVFLNRSRILANGRTLDNFDLPTLDAYLANLSQPT